MSQPPSQPSTMRALLAQHRPQRAGWLMGWGIGALVAAQLMIAIGVVQSLSLYRANVAIVFVLGFLAAAAGIGLVITAFSRLAANVEYLAVAEWIRRKDAKASTAGPVGEAPASPDQP